MADRNISVSEVVDVIKNGETITEYQDDKPYPSFLLFKFVHDRPLHIGTGSKSRRQCLHIITCYEPDRNLWDSDFKNKIN